MSDASIGGKTGVNIAAGKNLVGAFHAPEAVIAWTNTLTTLDERERRSGLAEIVKSAWIAGDGEVSAIEADARAMAAGDAEALSRGVELAARVKAEIVTADELEGGRRRVLNLGHTFGHAIEASTGYGTWTHGEAVSMGMVLAAQFSRELGLATGAFESRMTAMLEACGLPTRAPVMSSSAWLDPITRDKKRFGDGVRFVLGRGPGEIFDQHVEYVHLRSWLARIGVVAEDER
jgi:3-dehydroquinate synthase